MPFDTFVVGCGIKCLYLHKINVCIMWIVVIDNIVNNVVFITISDACICANVPYQSAKQGKRTWLGVALIECTVKKSARKGGFNRSLDQDRTKIGTYRNGITFDDDV